MASSGSAVVSLPSDTEILITREFDAPPELVWRAWTEPALVSQWWPGRRGRMVSCAIDLRVGGAYRYAMESNDGLPVIFHGVYREIEPPGRIVCTEVYEGAPPAGEPPVNVIGFEDLGGRTRLTMRTIVETRELRDMIVGSGMESGMQEAFDLLEALTAAGRASAAT